MEYTKGNWEHEGDGIITAADGVQIASVFPRDRLANAHLIAAAPALYEALKVVDDYLSAPYPENMKLKQTAADKLIAALSQAEGK